MLKKTAMLFLPLAILAGCGEPADTRPGQPVAHRQKAFKEMLKAFEPMGVMLRTDSYEAKRFGALALQVKGLSEAPWSYFGADTQYPPSHAKDEVWSDAAKFSAEKQTFLAAVDKLAAVGDAADAEKARVAYKAVEDSCKSCHKTFKQH